MNFPKRVLVNEIRRNPSGIEFRGLLQCVPDRLRIQVACKLDTRACVSHWLGLELRTGGPNLSQLC